MKHIRIGLIVSLVLLGGLWLAGDPAPTAPVTLLTVRSWLVSGTGVLAIGAMSFAMILAMRPVLIESYLGGLDKSYRLHRWFGISAAAFGVAHYLAVQAPKWLPSNAPRGPRQARVMETVPLFRFFQEQRGFAESIATLALVALLLLVALALIKRFPYRLFARSHRLLALVFAVLVVHGVILMPFDYWRSPIGPVLLLLMLGGVAASIGSLTRRVGFTHRAAASIASFTRHEENRVLQVELLLSNAWAGHEAGQFAFVTFDAHEGAHPFTIASDWRGDGYMQLLIKELGDYTRALPTLLTVGSAVTVEGPYGRFNFRGAPRRQIWVGGGIGVTPFIARLHELARMPDGKSVDLFYSTREPDAAFVQQLQHDADAAHVPLHVMVEATDGFLTVAHIRESVPDSASADVWFCGPSTFGHILEADFRAGGLARTDFHQELFEIR